MSLSDDVSSIRPRGPRQVPTLDQSIAKEIEEPEITEKKEIPQISWLSTVSMAVISTLLALAALSFLVPNSFCESN